MTLINTFLNAYTHVMKTLPPDRNSMFLNLQSYCGKNLLIICNYPAVSNDSMQ